MPVRRSSGVPVRMQVRTPGVGTRAPPSNRPDMATQTAGEPAPPAPGRIQAPPQRAARVQGLLQDMEVALLSSADKDRLRVLGGLKRAWRRFRGLAMRNGAAGMTDGHSS